MIGVVETFHQFFFVPSKMMQEKTNGGQGQFNHFIHFFDTVDHVLDDVIWGENYETNGKFSTQRRFFPSSTHQHIQSFLVHNRCSSCLLVSMTTTTTNFSASGPMSHASEMMSPWAHGLENNRIRHRTRPRHRCHSPDLNRAEVEEEKHNGFSFTLTVKILIVHHDD